MIKIDEREIFLTDSSSALFDTSTFKNWHLSPSN